MFFFAFLFESLAEICIIFECKTQAASKLSEEEEKRCVLAMQNADASPTAPGGAFGNQ